MNKRRDLESIGPVEALSYAEAPIVVDRRARPDQERSFVNFDGTVDGPEKVTIMIFGR